MSNEYVDATDDPADPDADADAQVLDPEAYTQKRRQKEIFNVRSEVAEIRLRARADAADGNTPNFDGLTAYRGALEAYLMETEPLFLRYEGGRELWRETHLGTFTLGPPEQAMHDQQTGRSGGAPTDADLTPREVTLEGLVSLLDMPNPLAVTYTVRKSGSRGKTMEPKEFTYQVPMHILDTAYRRINHFLADIGMDIDPTDDGGEWEV